MNATYTKYELLRLIRNKRAFIFSLIFPLALFLVIAGSNKQTVLDLGSVSIKFPTYYMVSMAGYGAMIAAISGGARIATERSVGWTRQLRLTPLPVRRYFCTKVITAYLMAVVSVALLYAAGILYGVSISPFSRWLAMTALLLIGILPFVAMGILVGHLLTTDSMGPAIGGGSAFFGFLGGQWFPLPEHGALHVIGEGIPSFWLTQASHVGIGAPGWGLKGFVVIGIWSLVMAGLAGWAYRRDTKKV
jgi:ABC-2 type transport system permease protein